MTDPSGPSSPTTGGASPAQPPTTTSSASIMARLDTSGRWVAGGAAAAIVILLLGVVLGAWEVGGYALVVLLAAIVALVLAFVAAPADGRAWPVPARDVALLAGVVMSVLAVLNAIEVVFDLDQIDDERGGVLGLVLTLGLAAASLAVFVGAWMARRDRDVVGAATRRSDRGTRIALAGLGLDIVAWLIMLTISVYSLGSTASFGIAASVLAVLVLVLGADPEHPWKLPIPAAWVAIGLSLVSAFMLLDLYGQWSRNNSRLEAVDSAIFFVHVVAVFVILAGAVVSAYDHQRHLGAPAPAA